MSKHKGGIGSRVKRARQDDHCPRCGKPIIWKEGVHTRSGLVRTLVYEADGTATHFCGRKAPARIKPQPARATQPGMEMFEIPTAKETLVASKTVKEAAPAVPAHRSPERLAELREKGRAVVQANAAKKRAEDTEKVRKVLKAATYPMLAKEVAEAAGISEGRAGEILKALLPLGLKTRKIRYYGGPPGYAFTAGVLAMPSPYETGERPSGRAVKQDENILAAFASVDYPLTYGELKEMTGFGDGAVRATGVRAGGLYSRTVHDGSRGGTTAWATNQTKLYRARPGEKGYNDPTTEVAETVSTPSEATSAPQAAPEPSRVRPTAAVAAVPPVAVQPSVAATLFELTPYKIGNDFVLADEHGQLYVAKPVALALA